MVALAVSARLPRIPTLRLIGFRRAFADAIAAEAGQAASYLPVAACAGALSYFAWPREPRLIWPLTGCALAALSFWCLRRSQVPRALALTAFFACAGFALSAADTARAPPWAELPRTAVIVTGSVAAVEALPEGTRVTLAHPSMSGGPPLARALRLRLRRNDALHPLPGDLLRIRALLRPPPPPDYPGARDGERDAFFSGIGGYGFALGPAQRVLRHPTFVSRLATLRASVAARAEAALPGPTGAIAATLLSGFGAAIPETTRVDFQLSGLAHLLAVAGLHIASVMALAFAAVRRGLAFSERAALFWPCKAIAAIAALAAGGVYLLMTGAHLPIVRSFIMASLVTLGLLAGRRALSLRGLALACLFLVASAPDQILGVSFQLSFSAVLALIAGWEWVGPRLRPAPDAPRLRRLLLGGAGLAWTSFLAGAATEPFAAYHFGTVTPYTVPANLLGVPLTAFWILPAGLLALALMPLGCDGIAWRLMGWGIDGVRAIAHAVPSLPGAALAVPQCPPATPVLFASGLVIICLGRTRLRLLGLVPMGGALLAAAATPAPDLLVTAGAEVIALRSDRGVLTETRPRASLFAEAAPRAIWGGVPAKPLPLSGEGCTPAACTLVVAGRRVLLVRGADWSGDCAPGIDLVVSAAPLFGACPMAAVIDRTSVAEDGAVTIRFASRLRIATDRAARGDRPWVRLPAPRPPLAPRE